MAGTFLVTVPLKNRYRATGFIGPDALRDPRLAQLVEILRAGGEHPRYIYTVPLLLGTYVPPFRTASREHAIFRHGSRLARSWSAFLGLS